MVVAKCSIDGRVDECIVLACKGCNKPYNIAFCRECWMNMHNLNFRTELIKLIGMIAQNLDKLGLNSKE